MGGWRYIGKNFGVYMKHVGLISELQEYFRENVGPLFCHPTANLLHTNRKMTGMVGIVRPITYGTKIKVDWSIDKDWKEVSSFYLNLNADTEYLLSDLSIELPGTETNPNTIPQDVDDRCKFDWRPNKRGQIVCIGDVRWTNFSTATPSRGRLKELKSWIGIIIDKCDDTYDEWVTVTFFRQSYTKTTNVPTDMLVRLPKTFKPKSQEPHNQDAAKARHKEINTVPKPRSNVAPKNAKFTKGDIVVTSPSGPVDDFHGLIGIVETTHKTEPRGDYGVTTYQYDINFDTLPNRNLSLVRGEGTKEFCIKRRLREFDLTKWDVSVSDRAHLNIYRVHAQRDKVWSLELQKECQVVAKSDQKITKEHGLETTITGGKRKITCRDMDYLWNSEALTGTLATMHTGLGIEQDERNPNKPETHLYIYAFEFGPDVGKYVKYRVYLGNLLKQKSKVKKFEKSLKNGKIRNPFQIRRYLKLKSLGHFYQVCKAPQYGEMVSDFVGTEE